MPAANLLPSADEAAQDQFAMGTLFETQFDPEFVEVQIPPEPAATNLLPSADEATLDKYALGALFVIQFIPELVEVKINGLGNGANGIITNLVPSAEEAIEDKLPWSVVLNVRKEFVNSSLPGCFHAFTSGPTMKKRLRHIGYFRVSRDSQGIDGKAFGEIGQSPRQKADFKFSHWRKVLHCKLPRKLMNKKSPFTRPKAQLSSASQGG